MRRTDVWPIAKRRAIPDLLTPSRKSLRTCLSYCFTKRPIELYAAIGCASCAGNNGVVDLEQFSRLATAFRAAVTGLLPAGPGRAPALTPPDPSFVSA